MQPDAPRPLLPSQGQPPTQPPPRFTPPAAPVRPSPLVPVAAVAVGAWLCFVTAAQAAFGWLVAEAASEIELFVPGWFPPTSAVFTGALMLVPAQLLRYVARRRGQAYPGSVAAGTAWVCATVAGTVLGCVRAVPLPQNEVLLLLTALVAAGLGVAARRVWQRPAGSFPGRGVGALAPAVGLLLLLPWLAIGALGGAVETLLAAAAALAVGYLVAALLGADFFTAYGRSRPWGVFVGGTAAMVALAPLAGVLGGPGVNLAELVTVTPIAFALAAMAGAGRLRRSDPALLVALAVVGPLAFVDPEETSLVLGGADVPSWTALAALLGLLVALVCGAVLGLLPRARREYPRWAAGVLAVALVAGGVAYLGPGRPGLYGERLLVVMAEQADLSGLAAMPDRPARLAATYQRLVATAERTQTPLRAQLDRFGIGYTPYYLVNAILVDAGPALRPFLAGRSDVDRVLLDERLRPLPAPAATTRGDQPAPNGRPQWNISMIHADRVWRELGVSGAGIVIGTSDSGVDGTHPALRDGFRGGDDSWYDPWNATTIPIDHSGHGTHTLGTAVGRDGIGVAPQARWVGCVNLDRNLGSPSLYLSCLQFMLAPFPPGGNPLHDGRPQRAPQILTNSWGCPTIEGCDLDALRPATAALAAAGIYVVAAAGNTGRACGTVVDPPAPYADVLSVGAVDRLGRVPDFSSRGPAPDGTPKPDLVAPGVGVLSAMPAGTYGTSDGTSMATPHIAGVVALMWSANPRLVGDIATTSRILRDTATATGPDAVCGGTAPGIVDAYAAVRAARAIR